MWSVCKKEFRQFFSSLTGYIAIIVFLLLNGLFLFVFPDTNILDFGFATLEKFFERWDVLICPVTVSPAIPHVPFGTPVDVDQHKVPYFIAGTAYTSPFNLTGHPSVVLPLTKSKDGLPIGVQLVGKRWSEPELLALAQKVALITGPFTPPPNYKQ